MKSKKIGFIVVIIAFMLLMGAKMIDIEFNNDVKEPFVVLRGNGGLLPSIGTGNGRGNDSEEYGSRKLLKKYYETIYPTATPTPTPKPTPTLTPMPTPEATPIPEKRIEISVLGEEIMIRLDNGEDKCEDENELFQRIREFSEGDTKGKVLLHRTFANWKLYKNIVKELKNNGISFEED